MSVQKRKFPLVLFCCYFRFKQNNQNKKCLTRRKNNPSASCKIRCDVKVRSIGWLSLYHVNVGGGSASALQFSVTGSCLATIVSIGCSIIFGAYDAKIEREKNTFLIKKQEKSTTRKIRVNFTLNLKFFMFGRHFISKDDTQTQRDV